MLRNENGSRACPGMTKGKRCLALVLALAMVCALALAGCGGGGASDGGSSDTAAGDNASAPVTQAPSGDTIKIGIVNPTTGPLAGFGEGSPWTENIVVDYVNNELGGIEVDGVKKPIEIILYDTESNATRCTELTQKLITEDKVDLIVVRHTPDTVNPAVAVCERYEVPCISADEPIDAFLPEGPFEWSFHAHWQLVDLYPQYLSLWDQAGFGPGTGAKVGYLFPSDADGFAWVDGFDTLEAYGYSVIDPGRFPADTTDYSDIVRQFKDADVNIVVGCVTNPAFSTFWKQAKQLGFDPDVVSVGKAYLLQADADAIGADLMDNLECEVWWDKSRSYESSLTGLTPSAFAEKYQEESGRNITPPMSSKFTTMEIAVDALTRAGTLNKEAIRDAIAQTDLDTIYGHIKYTSEHTSPIQMTGGQWQKQEDGSLKLAVINNSVAADLPTTGAYIPLKK
ncbi:MAG: ABC transporter substrate-binding protein [Clostridiales Family XIII bacterium]|nr:ABC transporter substrate-binding protein [Clostridiales Family XIII bacterium]